MTTKSLPVARVPRYVEHHWGGVSPAAWIPAAVSSYVANPLVLPLTRLSGGLVFPVLDADQVREGKEYLDLALVSVSPPREAIRQLAPLLAYGPSLVLLPPEFPHRLFELAELDLQGVGVSQARIDGGAQSIIRAERLPNVGNLAPWWRTERQHQLLVLAGR